GFVLQLDCPDLAMERARFFQDEPLEGFLTAVALHVDAINEAVAGLPRERIRLHLCWGNYDGPHTHDVPLEPLLPIVYRAKVGALSLPLASPRHQHELKAFRRHPLPAGMLFVPGVVDSTTNVVEHPEVVADRIVPVAEAIGHRTRELAGRLAHLGAFVRFEGSLDMRVRVMAAMTVARELDAVYVWGAQTGQARKLGVPESTIAAIRDRHTRVIPPEDAQIVEFTRDLIRKHRVDDAIVKALRARFGDDGFIQLTGAIGYYSMLAMTVNACELEAAPGAEVLRAGGIS